MVKLETTTAYTIKEAAELLHRTPTTVRGYIKKGLLRGQKIGNTWYVTDKSLADMFTAKIPEEIRKGNNE